MYASIINGVVSAVFEDRPALGPRECAQIVECGEDAQVGWRFEGGECVGPTLDELYNEACNNVYDRYNPALNAVSMALLNALAFDGPGQEAAETTLRAEYRRILATRSTAITAIEEEYYP